MRRILLAAILVFGTAEACAPDFFRAVLSYVRHPDLPRTEFIDGRLGVLQPTFARSYLAIAYRHLNGIGMNAQEREQARGYYEDRGPDWRDRMRTDWPARWRAARAQIASPPAPATSLITGGQMLYDPETHSFALNCADDAFRVAAHTLEERRARFGAGSAAFRSWLTAQDQVFHNCDGQKAEIPAEAAAELPAAIHADRAYQIAAANFYAGRYDEALRGFRAIGRDADSPWSDIARYLVVRTLLRMSDVPPAAQLTAEAQAILDDPKLDSIHGMTWNVAMREGIRQRDQTYFRELGRLLASKGQNNGLREELWNYTDMYDHVIGQADPNALYRSDKAATADVSRFRDVDLTDWIFSFQSRDASVFEHCVQRWRETHSTAWLLAALGHSSAKQARAAGLLDAARSIPGNSPAYLTAQFHLLRMGDAAAVREGADALLSGGALRGLPSSRNLFLGMRMLAAPGFDDFLKFAARKPVLVTLQMNMGEVPGFAFEEGIPKPQASERLDRDATGILNRQTPFRFLKEAALGATLSPELRREALLVAFTRGLMLDEDLSEIAGKLAEADPELAPLADAYIKDGTADGRRFAAAFLLLHRPEARPYFASGISRQSRAGRLDPYRDNWWCPVTTASDLDSRANGQWWEQTPNLLQTAAATSPPFVGESAPEARREVAKLEKLGAATDFLGSIALPFAETHAEDPRVPEALYWLVRAGHYGCAGEDTWKTTRAAFRVLQVRYGKTDWARRTPTWFKADPESRE